MATAKQCGFPVEKIAGSFPSAPTNARDPAKGPASTRLKGKARKLAKQGIQPPPVPGKKPEPKEILAVKDFVSLADYIAASTKPLVKVPSSFAVVLNRAISVRRSHGAQAEKSASESSANSHNYFIGILEHVQQVLRPRMAGDKGDTSSENIQNVTNKFEGLDVQEPSEAFLQAPDLPMPTSTTGRTVEVNYEAERMQDFEEATFALTLLLTDFSELRNVISNAWEAYKIGASDIVSASIMTNSAFDLARRAEEDVQHLFDKFGGTELLINRFYMAYCKRRGQDPESKERPGNELNFRVYDIAESVYLPTFTLLNSFSNMVQPDMLLPYKAGHFGTYDKTKHRSEKTAREKFTDDKVILCEVLSDFLTMHRSTAQRPFEDEFTRGLRKMFDTHELPLWLALAGQVFLDIFHTLGDEVERGYEEYERYAILTETSINANLIFHSNLQIETWPRENNRAFVELLQFIHLTTISDPSQRLLKKYNYNTGEPFKVLKWHPILSGLATFYLKAKYQDVSLIFQGAWGSIMYTAHLYNALRSEKLLESNWIDMSMVMHWHDEIFVGERPKNPKDYLKRFCLSMGYSARAFARNRRHKDRVPTSKNGPKGINAISNVSRTFVERYCYGSEQTNFTESDLEKLLAQGVWEEDSDSEGEDAIISMSRTRKDTNKKRWEPSRPLTAPEVLNALRNTIQSEAIEMSFDYLALHRICWSLLRSINEECEDDLRKYFGAGCVETETQLPFIVGYIFMAAANTDSLGSKLTKDEEAIKSKLLMRSGEVLKSSTIDSGHGSTVINSLRALGYAIQFEE